MAASAKPSNTPRDPKLYSKAEKIKMRIEQLTVTMNKDNNLNVSRDDLAQYAKDINELIIKNREAVRPYESHLKAAIIDLTEVPELNPHMQRISYLTALKDASKNIELFLACC